MLLLRRFTDQRVQFEQRAGLLEVLEGCEDIRVEERVEGLLSVAIGGEVAVVAVAVLAWINAHEIAPSLVLK